MKVGVLCIKKEGVHFDTPPFLLWLFLGVFDLMFKPCLNQKLNINQSLSIIYYASKTLKNGNHPLMLRIIQNGQTKYVSLGVNINPNF